MAALSISNVADAEYALSAPLTDVDAEAIYRANLDTKGFHQEVVRVVLLDAQRMFEKSWQIKTHGTDQGPPPAVWKLEWGKVVREI